MKKFLIPGMLIFLLIFLVGCGGGSGSSEPIGKTMTPDEINQRFTEVSSGLSGALMGNSYANSAKSASSQSLPVTTASNILKTESGSTYTWTGPDSLGWYTVTGTQNNIIKFRYIEKTNTLELKINDTTLSAEYFFSASKANNLWSGKFVFTFTSNYQGQSSTVIMKLLFSSINENYGCGIWDGFIEASSSGGVLIPNYQFTHFEASYVSSNPTTPIHLIGWVEDTSHNREDLDICVAVPTNGGLI